ncbi:siderophore-interacting protein [Oceanospirillum sediminis]|uniref:Siderophore-interacting protein n=1 Tax=Oceanospirillum sediminis TaxID=2760088 RepID=A0A839IUT3_9GAMM|nr:siderophore-interacting protein [Oceanospirillum sediminis]MBB1488430.1 siderophore-interacting protein [Oceanospirillum sediminis]
MAKPSPENFTVVSSYSLSPNMRRVRLASQSIQNYPQDAEGGYIKLAFPKHNQDKPLLRTYTISNIDHTNSFLDVDFVIHADGGPASQWSEQAQAGDTIQIAGPGAGKPVDLSADWFLIAGDMTALPAIRANLKRLPADAKGYLILELISEEDKQALDLELSQLPQQLEVQWLINPNPGINKVLNQRIRSLTWLEGKPAIWLAGELDEVLESRKHLKAQPDILQGRMYVSSYWQHGMTEDRHKIEKQKRL